MSFRVRAPRRRRRRRRRPVSPDARGGLREPLNLESDQPTNNSPTNHPPPLPPPPPANEQQPPLKKTTAAQKKKNATKNSVFNVGAHPAVAPGALALNSVQRRILRVSARDAVSLRPYTPTPSLPTAAVVYAEVAPVAEAPAAVKPAGGPARELAAPDVVERLLKDLSGQVLTAGQQVVFELQGVNLRLVVGSITAEGEAEGGGGAAAAAAAAAKVPPGQPHHREVPRAAVAPGGATAFIFTNSNAHAVRITGQRGIATTAVFKHRQLNFESLGIGGLDRQFEAIFRRAFASRVFPPAVLERLGIHHVKVGRRWMALARSWRPKQASTRSP